MCFILLLKFLSDLTYKKSIAIFLIILITVPFALVNQEMPARIKNIQRRRTYLFILVIKVSQDSRKCFYCWGLRRMFLIPLVIPSLNILLNWCYLFSSILFMNLIIQYLYGIYSLKKVLI